MAGIERFKSLVFCGFIMAVLVTCAGCSSCRMPRFPPASIVGPIPLLVAYKQVLDTRNDLPVLFLNDNGLNMQGLSRQMEDEIGPYFIIQLGGAMVLSPRLLLLSNHQMVNSNEFVLHIQGKNIKIRRIVAIDKGEPILGFPDVQAGLHIFKLDEPILDDNAKIMGMYIANSNALPGQCWWVLMSYSDYRRLNGDRFKPGVVRVGEIVYLRGIVRKKERFADALSPKIYDQDQFIVELDSLYALDGASGFPILVYSEDSNEWTALGILIASFNSNSKSKTWVIGQSVNLKEIIPD